MARNAALVQFLCAVQERDAHSGMPSRTACATIAFAALAAVSASAQQDTTATAEAAQQDTAAAPAPALNYSPQRYRLLPPYADPGFVRGPVPPPAKNYLIPLGEVVAIDASVWAFNYLQGKDFAQISWASVKQNFDKGWIDHYRRPPGRYPPPGQYPPGYRPASPPVATPYGPKVSNGNAYGQWGNSTQPAAGSARTR
jgi:hypothetical protein